MSNRLTSVELDEFADPHDGCGHSRCGPDNCACCEIERRMAVELRELRAQNARLRAGFELTDDYPERDGRCVSCWAGLTGDALEQAENAEWQENIDHLSGQLAVALAQNAALVESRDLLEQITFFMESLYPRIWDDALASVKGDDRG